MHKEWNETYTAAELESRFELTASLDRRFAIGERDFYQTRTAQQLKTLASYAWNANDRDGYVMAQSYLQLQAAH